MSADTVDRTEVDEAWVRKQMEKQPWWPGGQTDAYEWADAFLIITKDNPDILTDRDTLMGWFANAIMAGYDEAVVEHDPTVKAFFKALGED